MQFRSCALIFTISEGTTNRGNSWEGGGKQGFKVHPAVAEGKRTKCKEEDEEKVASKDGEHF